MEQELESMLVVLDMKKEENDQLKACNNTLRLDLERITGVDIQLQVERQKTEEMSSVIKLKNDQLRQLLDEYDNVQHQLDIEVFHLVDGPSNVGPFLVLTVDKLSNLDNSHNNKLRVLVFEFETQGRALLCRG